MMRWVFGADTGPFRKGLDEMRTQTKAFSGSVKGMMAAAFGVGAIIAGFRNLLVEMDRVQKLGIRFGESAETIQRIGLAADLAGSDLETVARAMSLVTKNAVDAARNGGRMAENFDAIGISAERFANLPMTEKIMELKRGMESAEGNGAKLASMMDVLGRSGGDLIPLLQSFSEEANEVGVVSQSTVDSIAKFNDAITTLKQQAQVAGAFVFDVFRVIFGTIGAVIGGAVGVAMVALKNITGAATDAGSVIKNTLSGDFGAAGAAVLRFARRAKRTFDGVKNEVQATGDVIQEMFDDMGSSSAPKTAGPDVEDLQAQAEAALKTEEEKKKLVEEIAKIQEDARMAELSLAEKILELERQRVELLNSIDVADVGVEGLEATKEALLIEKELAKLREQEGKQAEAAAKKEEDAKAKTAERIASLEAESAAIDREQNLAGMSEENRMAALIAERSGLQEESINAAFDGDRETELEKGIAAKSLTPEIEALAKSIADKENEGMGQGPSLPGIATSSLASIGAGGSANLLTRDTTAERQVSLLEIIAKNTGRTETGNVNRPEPI